MEDLIQLTETDLEQIAGGVGFAFHTASQSASGGSFLNSVAHVLSQTVSPSSATQTVSATSKSI
jgi:hypothetical protein